MKYCTKCILPDTRPNLKLNINNVCSSCLNSDNKKNKINWRKREIEFRKLTNKIKIKSSNYDCVIPVSGGKDSTWQVLTALKYKMRPLCVTWKTPSRNQIGQDNLNNLVSLGVDHIDFTINPKIEKYFILKSFKKFGSTLIPMHMAIHGIPTFIALKYNIPLVIQGENSAMEYGGNNKLSNLKKTNLNYLKKYGVTHETTSKDWFDNKLNKKNMLPYYWPNFSELKKKNIKTIFLGYYFKFDPKKSYKIAQKSGFKKILKPKTGVYNFADIDDDFLITIHHWLKWYKFGFTRTWDNLSIEIRNNRLTRNKAIKILKTNIDKKPINEIKKFCKYLNISENNFYKIIEKFRNKKIWKKNKGTWYISNFLIKDFKW